MPRKGEQLKRARRFTAGRPKKNPLVEKSIRDAKSEFLAALRAGRIVGDACDLAGVARTTIYKWREKDEAFASEWASIVERVTDRIESEAIRIAVDGTLEPVFHGGKQVTNDKGEPIYVRKVHPRHVQFMLERRRADVYGRRDTLDVNVRAGVLVAPAAMSVDDWIAEHAGEGEPAPARLGDGDEG